MKIYTKTGDKGETALLGGTRVMKHHQRIEAYGTVDELNSVIGFARDHLTDQADRALLLEVQERLFTVGAALATDPSKTNVKKPDLIEADVEKLERSIDHMNTFLEELKNFILPGGHVAVSAFHVARCVCRRAERHVTRIAESEPVDEIVVRYLNRLSDWLFVLARKVGRDHGVTEIPWKPRG
jgi:cob(I)alamin adenosyltransferase